MSCGSGLGLGLGLGLGRVGFRNATASGILGADGLTWLRSDLGITATLAAFTAPSDLQAPSWTKQNCTVTATQITDTNDASAVIHRAYAAPVNTALNHAISASVDLKAGTKTWAYVTLSASSVVNVNLATGAIGGNTYASPTLTSLGDGWWRLRMTCPANNNVTHSWIQVYTSNGDGQSSYQGDGTGTIFATNFTAEQRLVSAWADQSGNGRNVSNATASRQPDWSTVDGFPGLYFDGVDDFLRGTWTWNKPAHLWIVVKTVAQVAAIDGILDGAAVNSFRLTNSTTLHRFFAGGATEITAAVTPTNWNFTEIRADAAGNGAISVNGVPHATSATLGTGALGGLHLGSIGNQTLPSRIVVREVIAKDTIQPADKIAAVNAYLVARYGF